MAQIISPAIMDELRTLAQPLAAAAMGHGVDITANDPSAVTSPDAVAAAEAVNAFTAATSALLQCFPMNQAGLIVSLATVTGTILGQADDDRSRLWQMFQYQASESIKEIAAARMIPQGNA